jgi:WD40 repeat protein
MKRPKRPPAAHVAPAKTLRGHAAASLAAALTPDARTALTTSLDGTARLWSGAARCGRALAHPAAVLQGALSADGAFAATACADGAVRVWPVAGHAAAPQYELREAAVNMPHAYGCALSADGRTLWATFRDAAAGGGPCAGFIVRVAGWHAVPVKDVFWREAAVWDVFVAADGDRLCVVEERDGAMSVAVLDGRDGGVVREFAGLSGAVGACMDAPGRRVAVADARSLRIFDVESGLLVRRCAGYACARDCDVYVAMTGDGRRVVANGRDGVFKVWDVASGRCEYELRGHTDDAGGCGISADGRCVVTASDDATVRFWDVADAATRRDPPPPGDESHPASGAARVTAPARGPPPSPLPPSLSWAS